MKNLSPISVKMLVPCIFAVALSMIILFGTSTAVNADESGKLEEAAVQAYLEEKVSVDPGSCLVDDMKLEIIGIGDLVPGQQAVVYYKFEYVLKCNRSKKTESGQGVLEAIRLRDGSWMDRETVSIISK